MKLREIFRYEIEYRVRSASTWLYGVFLFLLAIWMFLATADSDGLANAPERLAGGSALVAAVGMLVTAALFGDAGVRDSAVGMDALLFAAPIRKIDYLGGRFLAALLVNAVLMIAILIGFVTATALIGHFDPKGVGPFHLAAYLQPYFIFMMPNLLFAAAILFTIAVLSRHIIPVYLGAIALFVTYLVAMNTMGQTQNPVLSLLADPLGFRALEETTKYWSAVEQNTRLIGLPAALAWNRAVWIAVAAAVLALLHRRFRFAHAAIGGRRIRRLTVDDVLPARSRPVEVPRIAGHFDARTSIRQTLSVARRSLAEIAGSRWFLVVVLGCIVVTLLMGWNIGETVFETSVWPRTLLVAGTVLAGRITPIIYALIALYAGELVWKDRDANMDEMADAAPVTERVAVAGRFIALIGIILMLEAACMIGGILIQALQGYHHFEPGLYLRVLFGLKLTEYIIFAALAMTVQVLVNHKYVAHMVLLLAFLAALALRMFGLVDHHLLLYGTDPGWTYSDMNGFGPFITAVAWFRLYWAAWALLLGVVAIVFWMRGRESGLRRRFAAARARFTMPVMRIAGVAVALVLLLGGFIFYNTNVLNEYRSPHEQGATKAAYEKRYARYENTPQPTIVSAGLRIEIYPDRPAVELRGSYRLVNRTDAPIDSLHVFMDPEIDARSISFDRVARPVLVDEDAQYRIYELEHALAPGDAMQLTFDVAFQPRGFRNSGNQTEVVANGAYFNRSWLPFIVYQPIYELTDDDARKRFGLGAHRSMPGPEDANALRRRWSMNNEDLVAVDAVIGTAADQIAVTPGVLRGSWVKDGRRYFHYVTEQPESFGSVVFSAKYAVVEDHWQDVALKIFHDPAHTYDLDGMMHSMKASLAYYTRQFGDYPYGELRIVEYPRYGGFGHAHPQTIAFTEDAFFTRPREGEFDQAFFGTAHEVAHTWWGGQVRGGRVRGAGLLSETLANYSAMMVVEKAYGVDAARRVYDYQMDRYLRRRASFPTDVPLVDVENHPHITYGKGAVAMYALRDAIGEERVNAALRSYLERYRDAGPPYPTSRDLLAQLRAVTPDSMQAMLTDLFETVTLWRVKTEHAAVERTASGAYVVTLEVNAKKARSDSVGHVTEVPMNDLVDIGVFAPADGTGLGEPLYLKRHRIHSGRQTIRITVSKQPAQAGIDPYHKLIDRQRDDNVVEVDREDQVESDS